MDLVRESEALNPIGKKGGPGRPPVDPWAALAAFQVTLRGRQEPFLSHSITQLGTVAPPVYRLFFYHRPVPNLKRRFF
eukprot:9503728-Pyramimonas_sp.AAC.1